MDPTDDITAKMHNDISFDFFSDFRLQIMYTTRGLKEIFELALTEKSLSFEKSIDGKFVDGV